MDAATRRGSRWLGPAAFSLRTRALDQGFGTAWSTGKSTNPASQVRGSSHGAHVPCLLLSGLWRQRRSLGRLWWAGSIGGSSHHPRLLGLSSVRPGGACGALVRPCAPRHHAELTLLCCCCGVSRCLFHRVRLTAAQSGAECPRDQAEGAEVGSLSKVTMGMQNSALEWTSTASFARVVVLLVLLCVLF